MTYFLFTSVILVKFLCLLGNLKWRPSAITKNSKKHENDNISITTKWILTKFMSISCFNIKYLKTSQVGFCYYNEQNTKLSMQSYQLCVTMMFAFGRFDFLQFGIPRWQPSAITNNSTEHEIDNISITAEWILINFVSK